MHGQSFSPSAKERLRELGARPRKRLSQSFLEDGQVAAAIVRAARLDTKSEVLEVGPGLGIMTRLLAEAARRVVAVEIDPLLADDLRTQLADERLTVITADILTFDAASWFDAPYTVVANLPYHVTSPALRHLLQTGPPFASRLVVMVQAEVAERLAASPGKMSALAVATQAQANVSIMRRVPAAGFYPRPKVDSAVVVLEPLPDSERRVGRAELDRFVTLVQAGFKQPRKTLANSLADGLGVPRLAAAAKLEAAGLDPSLRPQALSVADWVRLFKGRVS